MFDNLMSMWQQMQGAAALPDTGLAADMLARTGDPNMMAPLFADAAEWSPTNFGDMFQGATLQPGGTPTGANGGLSTSAPAMQMAGDVTGQGTNPVASATGIPDLTPEQYKALMGMMPDSKGYVSPAPGVGRSQQLAHSMVQLNPGQLQQTRPRTLADYIYGGGR